MVLGIYTDSSNTGARAGISADNTYDAALYYVGETTKSYGINFVDGNKFNNASNSSYGSAFTQNSILMTAYDADNGKLWWGIDGIWYASGDPATGTNAAFTSIPENDYFPTISDSSLSNDADSFWLNAHLPTQPHLDSRHLSQRTYLSQLWCRGMITLIRCCIRVRGTSLTCNWGWISA
jgi:hypothetical protein